MWDEHMLHIHKFFLTRAVAIFQQVVVWCCYHFNFYSLRVWKDDFEKKLYSVSNSGLKNNTTSQILNWKKYGSLDFGRKFFRNVEFYKKRGQSKNHVLTKFIPLKRLLLNYWCFLNSMILN